MSADAPAYYQLVDSRVHGGQLHETFAPTPEVGGPWTDTMQHGGPPSALLVRAMDRTNPRPGMRLTQLSVDLLGPVPMRELTVRARVDRPGRRIERLSSELVALADDAEERVVARGTAWRLAMSDSSSVAHAGDVGMPTSPDDQATTTVTPGSWVDGFANTIWWRATKDMGVRGTPSTGWFRLDRPLVSGEEQSPLLSLVAIADIANGLGGRLDEQEWTFLNTNLVIHVHTVPRGEWIGMSAESTIGADGVGMSSAVLYDADGPVGRVTQNLLIEKR